MMFHHPLNYIFVWGAGQARSLKLPLYIVVSLEEFVNISFIIGWRDMISMSILGCKKISPTSAGEIQGNPAQRLCTGFACTFSIISHSFRLPKSWLRQLLYTFDEKIGCALTRNLCAALP
ncbi:MAG: hypothetical protein HFE94_07575 [Acutalibacter sp.]|nr:hypothetical protein [Acutalibacter sp.]